MASPVDLISFAVVPAILLLSVGEFSGWFYPGALVIVMAGVLCLAYFNVYGVDENGTYAGLPLDFTPFVVSAVSLLQNSLNHNVFAAILYTTIVMLALLHVGPVRTPKTGRHMELRRYRVRRYLDGNLLLYPVDPIAREPFRHLTRSSIKVLYVARAIP